jgi:hypothetical protein
MAAIDQGAETSGELAARTGEPLSDVHRALVRLVEVGLVDAADGRVRLTDAGGQRTAADAARAEEPAAPGDPLAELVEAAQSLGSAWVARSRQAGAARDSAAAALLASDEERDAVVQHLAEAFTQGRLTSAQLDERTGRALAARTHGELDDALVGLGGLPREAGGHPVRAVVFWVATVVLSPFLLFGSLFVLFGSDAGDRFAGTVFLTLTAPPLLALWRWWRPRRRPLALTRRGA